MALRFDGHLGRRPQVQPTAFRAQVTVARDELRQLRASPDGKQLLAVYADRLEVLDVESGTGASSHGVQAIGADWIRDAVVFATPDGGVKRWQPGGGSSELPSDARAWCVGGGTRVAIGGEHGVQLYEPSRTLGELPRVRHLAFCGDDSLVVQHSDMLLSRVDGTALRWTAGLPCSTTCLALAGAWVLAGGVQDGVVTVIDAASGQRVATLQTNVPGWRGGTIKGAGALGPSLVFSAIEFQPEVAIWEVGTWRLVEKLSFESLCLNGRTPWALDQVGGKLALRPDRPTSAASVGARVFVGTRHGVVMRLVWDWN